MKGIHQYAKGGGIDCLSKDEAVMLLRAAGVKVGDYARSNKAETAAKVAQHHTACSAKARELVGAPVVARFPGKCSKCGEKFPEGTLITMGTSVGTWQHATCAGNSTAAESNNLEDYGPDSGPDHSGPAESASPTPEVDSENESEQADSESEQPDALEQSITEALKAVSTPEQEKQHPDAFVANDGQPGLGLISGIAAIASMQVAACMATQQPAKQQDAGVLTFVSTYGTNNSLESATNWLTDCLSQIESTERTEQS